MREIYHSSAVQQQYKQENVNYFDSHMYKQTKPIQRVLLKVLFNFFV